jgi:hypothetical protein
MIQCKFTWNDGSAHTFTPTLPPIQKVPVHSRSAIRDDDWSGDGLEQSITSRVDKFRTVNFTMVPSSDFSEWEAFIDYAIEKNVFTYYPDASDAGTHFDYTLEDTDWDPKFATKSSEGPYIAFVLKMRLYVE